MKRSGRLASGLLASLLVLASTVAAGAVDLTSANSAHAAAQFKISSQLSDRFAIHPLLNLQDASDGRQYQLRSGGLLNEQMLGSLAADARLRMNRVFEPRSGASVYFGSRLEPSTVITDSVFGFEAPLQFNYFESAVAPAIFGEILTRKSGNDFMPSTNSASAMQVGVHFKLMGGQHTIAVQSIGPATGAVPQLGGAQQPAVFAFYNLQAPPALNLAQPATENGGAFSVAQAAPAQNASMPYSTFAFQLNPISDSAGPLAAYAPTARGASVDMNFPVSLAHLNGKLHLGAQTLSGIQPSSLASEIFGPAFASSVTGTYRSLHGGMTLALPLFDRKATVSLDGLFESLQRNDQTAFLYGANSAYLAVNPNAAPFSPVAGNLAAVPGPAAVFFYPNFLDVRAYTGAASLAVPVGRALTVNGSYNEQFYDSEALNALTQALDQRKRTITGGLVYNIPNSNSSVNLFFNRYQYSADQLPTYTWTENRQNIYFSVKF